MPEDSRDPRPPGLLVTRNFPPLQGGMERLNQRMLAELAAQWSMALCGPDGAGGFATPGVRVFESPLQPLWRFLARTLRLAWRHARAQRPRFVLAGSGLTAPIAVLAARAGGGRSGVYLHGLDVIVPSRIYQWLWLPWIRRCDFVLANSANTARQAVARGVPAGRVQVLHPGVDLPSPDAAAGGYRVAHGLQDATLLLSVGRLTARKGLVEFVRDCLPAIVAARPEVLLLVVGGEAGDALHGGGGGQRERIEQAAAAAGVGAHVRFLGRCDDATLAALYRDADLHVFPVRDLPGDVEGFGMVAIEAAAHGLPTLAYAAGGVVESVADGVSGRLVPAGDSAALVRAVLDQIARPFGAGQAARCREFAAGFAWDAFGRRLREIVAREAR